MIVTISCVECQNKTNATTSDITMFVGDSSSCSVKNFSITSTQTSITVTGLLPGKTYFFRINCSVVCCANLSTRPAQVENITVLNSSNSSLTVEWPVPLGYVNSYVVSLSGSSVTSPVQVSGQTNVSISLLWSKPLSMDGVTVSYEVSYKSNQPGVNLETLNYTYSLNVTLTNLLPGSQYDITVVTIGVKGLRSSYVNLTAYTAPNAVQNLSVSGVSSNSVNLTWLPPTGTLSLFSYNINITSPDQTLSTTSNNYQITPLQPGTQYSCSVRALIMAANIFGPSQLIQCNTKPLPVTNLIASPVGTTEMRLSWSRQSDYKPSYQYNLSVNGERWIQSNNETANVPNLVAGNNYTFTVQTVANGMSSDSVAISAFTGLGKASNISAVGTTHSMRVEWRPPDSTVSLYNVKILLNEAVLKTENRTNATTVVFSDLLPGTQYYVIVTSISGPIMQDSNSVSNATCKTLHKPHTNTHYELCMYKPYTKIKHTLHTVVSSYTDLQALFSGGKGSKAFPSTVIPKLDNQRSNHSLLVKWVHPVGGLDMYILNISSEGWSSSKVLSSTEHNHTFSQLKAATVFTVTLTTVKEPFRETSDSVIMATYPNRPGEIKILLKSSHSLLFQWDEAESMTAGSLNYNLTYWPSYNTSQYLTPNNTFLLDGLRSGTTYNVSVVTVGPMGFQSDPIRVYVTTKPDPVQNLQAGFTTINSISLNWTKVEGVPKYVVRVYSEKEEKNSTIINNNMTIYNLMPSTSYNISVQSSTSDNTEGEAVWRQACTDAAPVKNVSCMGPNLTLPMLNVSWSPPPGNYKGFKFKLNSFGTNTTSSLTHTFTGLKYNTLYKVMLWTTGCGKESTVESITCMTGITEPVVPKIEAVSISELQYNKFTLNLQSDIFNDSNGPVLYYGVLVYSGTIDCLDKSKKFDQCLMKTYEDWKAKRCSTFLAVIRKQGQTGSRNVQTQTVIIGDETMWEGYKNGELNAKDTYNFAVIAFTRLEINNSLVDVSNSYYSVSDFYQSPVTLPENPVVIGAAAAGASVAALLVVIIIVVISYMIVDVWSAYYRRQRADSFCGFAEEFENLRPVGINQSKTVAQAPENKAKNRYNNVLPYDSSRVKLSVLSSPFDDYINANYMPGYSSKKEFIAAQGPLPCTVDDFWRLIWEKNVHTIVMLTKCNEQGRVKCEEYWPAETKRFSNLTVMNISEIPLEDWTLRDFEVKNVKTAESRSVHHFHFTAWPDHGVPETTELLINFRHLVREHMDQYSRHSPTLVHCSAGVGRTGTFIAIDRLIFQIEQEGVVDVYGIIHDLRMHRPLMVQTEDQYVFLNQCAMDIIKSRTGNNVDLIYQNTAALNIYENFEPLQKAKNGYHKA
uniref:protein-tyrosine-phosphatase n=1 Tax=Cyprinus carpio TaxID=7962 RepID=A0A8C2K595_CYPCA